MPWWCDKQASLSVKPVTDIGCPRIAVQEDTAGSAALVAGHHTLQAKVSNSPVTPYMIIDGTMHSKASNADGSRDSCACWVEMGNYLERVATHTGEGPVRMYSLSQAAADYEVP